MRKLKVAAFVSLDGVMQAPGGPEEDPSGGFPFGGWLPPITDEAVSQAVGDLFDKPFELVLGRRTYDIFAGYWPLHDDHPIGKAFNATVKHVATRDPDLDLAWNNSRWLGADPVAEIRRLKAQDGPDLLTQGSADFLRTLFAADVVDDLQTITFPVMLGDGKRLFQTGVAPRAWRLTEAKITPGGSIVGRYARAGAVETGSFIED